MVSKSRGSGNSRVQRFRGPKANDSNASPPSKPTRRGVQDRRPYKGCVSAEWAAQVQFDMASLPDDPPNFVLRSLTIPDEDLDECDKAWLGDDERGEL